MSVDTWIPDYGPAVASLRAVRLSSAVNQESSIGYGSTAPTGTDQTSTIQSVIDALAAAYPRGFELIWDVATSFSAPVYLPSNIVIFAPAPDCGVIMRAGANCPMFRLKGMATDATTNKQNTFGKVGSNYGATPTYRSYDRAYINNKNITIRGGTWNGNRAQQTGTIFTLAYGFPAIFQFYGFDGVTLDGCLFLGGLSAIPVHLLNGDRLAILRWRVDNSPLPVIANLTNASYAMAGIQVNGPMGPTPILFADGETHVSDDAIAINADDSNAAAINSGYAGGASYCTPGVNWPCCGDIPEVRIVRHHCGRGIEDLDGYCFTRFFSTVHRIGKVLIDAPSGVVRGLGSHWGPFGASTQLSGPGNIGSIEVRNCSLELIDALNNSTYGTALFEVRGNVDSLRITDRRRGDVQSSPVPDVNLVDIDGVSPTVRSVVLTGDYDSTTSNAVPQIKVSIPVNQIHVNTRSRTPSGIASPVLLTATGAVIDLVDFAGDVNGPTNLVNHAAGTLTTLLARGSHRNANGGSPLAVASGKTVTNYWYKDLAYAHAAVSAKSGSGTVTNDNDYAETLITTYAEDGFAGTNGNLIAGRTPAPTSPGHNWAVLEGTGSNHTIQSNKARFVAGGAAESEVVDCGHPDGTVTASAAFGVVTGSEGLGLLFRVTDASNYWLMWVNSDDVVTLYKNVAGSTSAVGSDYAIVADTASHALKVVPSGNTFQIYYDGVSTHGVINDSFNATATKFGIRAYNNTATFDDFKMTS